MLELNKRIFTSLILLTLLFISINNVFILSLILSLTFFQLFYEFNFILKKIYYPFKKINLFILLLIILIFIGLIHIEVFLIFFENNLEKKLFFYFILTICISSDIGGYTFGKIFKGKKLSKISPNKTYSGTFGSYLFSIILTLIIFNNHINSSYIIFIIILLSTITQIGDLFISYLKRKAKIKDTGFLLPGHGGLLDRFDGLIFALPIGLLIFEKL